MTMAYVHSKTGNPYTLVCQALSSEDKTELVVYMANYKGEFPDGQVWVRPAVMWDELVDVDGKMVPRFVPAEPVKAVGGF